MDAKLLTAERFVDMRMGCSYRYVYSYTEYFRPHYHDYYEIFIPLEGEAVHLVNGYSVPLKRGQAVFIRPNDTHDYICCGETPFQMLNITFTREIAEEIFAFLGEGFNKNILLSAELPPEAELSNDGMKRYAIKMAEIVAINKENTEKLKTEIKLLILSLLAEDFSRCSEAVNSDIPQWLLALREDMRKFENFVVGMEIMPSLCGKSREHIARSMKKYYGITASAFVCDLRLNYIANMLAHSDKKILDIVFESGFNNLSWASDCFSKKFGCTMSAYRHRVQ